MRLRGGLFASSQPIGPPGFPDDAAIIAFSHDMGEGTSFQVLIQRFGRRCDKVVHVMPAAGSVHVSAKADNETMDMAKAISSFIASPTPAHHVGHNRTSAEIGGQP